MKLFIQGALLVYAGGVKQEDILISQGKIAEIKESLRPPHDAVIINGSGSYILPGFLGSAQDSAVHAAVTTRIFPCFPSGESTPSFPDLDRLPAGEETDFLYHAVLERLDKPLLRKLAQKRIKVLNPNRGELEKIIQNRHEWLPLLNYLGMVLHVAKPGFKQAAHLDIPELLSYAYYKPVIKPRTVQHIQQASAEEWIQKSGRLDPYAICRYWLDSSVIPYPRFRNQLEFVRFLHLLSQVCSRIPAKLYGVFPRKGALRIGADADLVFVREDAWTKDQVFQPDLVIRKGCRPQEIPNSGERLESNQTYAFWY